MDRRVVKNIVLGLIIGAVLLVIGVSLTLDGWNVGLPSKIFYILGFGMNGMSIAFLIDSEKMYRQARKQWEEENK